VEQVDVTLAVGARLEKTVRIFGERVWGPGIARAHAPTKPLPFSRMPIVWERSFGGTDPDHPETFDARNPCGRGVRRHFKEQDHAPLPNFEDPKHLVEAPNDRPRPVGFSPVAPYWQPRARYGGTFDERWQQERFPLLPEDLDARYFNSAPEDQQLQSYQPGEEVRLTYMSETGHDRFALPRFEVPVILEQRGGAPVERTLVPDTIVVEPAAHRLSLAGRCSHPLEPDLTALRAAWVGEPTMARRRAIATGKEHLDFRRFVRGRPD
jgi:hypothetical protein